MEKLNRGDFLLAEDEEYSTTEFVVEVVLYSLLVIFMLLTVLVLAGTAYNV